MQLSKFLVKSRKIIFRSKKYDWRLLIQNSDIRGLGQKLCTRKNATKILNRLAYLFSSELFSFHNLGEHGCWELVQWFQMAKTRQNQINLTWFDDFFAASFIRSISDHCMCIIFKICQTVARISMIYQFHDFFDIFFWRDLAIWSNWVCGGGRKSM